jgi:glycerophosphoryl diester phosphodiesterase
MRVIGHRGCPDHFPENTAAAVRGAAPHVDWVEVDVQRCASGDVVVFHDDHLDRLTAANGRVRDTTRSELSGLTIKNSDEGIPTLDAVLDALPPSTGINVELKHTGMSANVEALVRGRPQECVVSSFESEALDPVEEVPTALLFADSFAANLDRADELGCEFVHPHHGLVDAERAETARERGFEVNAWTVTTREEVQRLRSAGVDGVIVDSWEIVG